MEQSSFLNNLNDFKDEYPLVFYFLQEKLQKLKYGKIDTLKQLYLLIKLFFINPLQNFFFNLKLYLRFQYSKINTSISYVLSIIHFYTEIKSLDLSLFSQTLTLNKLKDLKNDGFHSLTKLTYQNKIITITIIVSIISLICIYYLLHHHHHSISNNYLISKENTNLQLVLNDRFNLSLNNINAYTTKNKDIYECISKYHIICLAFIRYINLNQYSQQFNKKFKINQCRRVEQLFNLTSNDIVADFNFGWCGYGRYFCQRIPNLKWYSCVYYQERVNAIQQIINNSQWNSNIPFILTKEDLINRILKRNLHMNKLLWIDFQFEKDKNSLKLILNRMVKSKNFKGYTYKNYGEKILILLEYTVIQRSMTDSIKGNIEKKCNIHNIKNFPGSWSIQYYTQFLKENGFFHLNEEIKWDEGELNFKEDLLNYFKNQNLKVERIIDISSDYEKTLWCWTNRLKQALDSNSFFLTEMDYETSSIYFSYLLQTLVLFQEQKLKRYHLLLSF
ncbi:hypothetical protein H8356DRAFT_1304529 [Neocallimastix lanati (nom. inval.)]|nr:hypothetical protein H8356DRAFT_1304529 [Neocallimastix sp. JGI-2020a]